MASDEEGEGNEPDPLLSDIASDTSEAPHRFEGYLYSCSKDGHWDYFGQACLKAWDLEADVLFDSIEETGFEEGACRQILNEIGADELPSTPPENEDITKAPPITDLSEIMTKQALDEIEEDIVFPHPRALHKEQGDQQHKGIDLIGYKEEDGEILLYVIEVMASVEEESPPGTVYSHKSQLKGRLHDNQGNELLSDLRNVHSEADDQHKDVINGLLTALYDADGLESSDILAVPVLVRRSEELDEDDWGPFMNATEDFENYYFPSTVFFLGLETKHNRFTGFLDDVKDRLVEAGIEGGVNGS